MAVTQEGEFFWDDKNLYGGIRQDLPSSERHYRILKNMHLLSRGALKKRKGTKTLAAAISGTPEIRAAFDAHFNDGSQKLVVVAGADAYVYNTATTVFDAQSQSLTDGATSMVLFANNLILNNGTDFEKYTGSAWSAVGGTPPVGSLLTVHANRLLVSGRSAAPYEFYYSGVRDLDSWDVSNDKVIVGGTSGEAIKGLGTLGRRMFLGGEQNTWVYLQSATNPGDWDFVNLSETVGPMASKSVFEVTHKHIDMTLFWGPDGPMVAYLFQNALGLKPLWDPIYKMVDGVSDTVLTGINTGLFSQISGGYNPELKEACFGVPNNDGTENNTLLCYEVDSLVDYIVGQREQPIVQVKDNGNSGIYPCDTLTQVRVDESTGLPSTTGRNRLYGGRQGELFRLEAPNTYKDSGDVPITFWIQREGYNGEEDGVSGFEKVAKKATVQATQNGGFEVTVTVSSDGGAESGIQALSLDAGLGLWGDGGDWTTDPSKGKWNQATIQRARGDYGIHGVNFMITVTDYGSISNVFELAELSLDGSVYERQ